MSSKTGPSPTKRTQSSSTTATLALKPTCKIHSLAIIADKASLTGPNTIEIGENSILHPYAKIRAEDCNVRIGKNCMIAEKAVIGLAQASPPGEEGADSKEVVLEDGVSMESGAVIEAAKIGENSTIEVGAKIGKGAVLGQWCKVGPLCEVNDGEVLEDFTLVYGYGEKRVDVTLRDHEEAREMRLKGRRKEIELLRVLVPDAGAKWR